MIGSSGHRFIGSLNHFVISRFGTVDWRSSKTIGLWGNTFWK
jgi:hypothetical protein